MADNDKMADNDTDFPNDPDLTCTIPKVLKKMLTINA